MVLQYILVFSLLIGSAIKIADLVIKSDQLMRKEQREFIKKTRATHERGSISLSGALLVLMFSALLFFYAFKFKIELKESRYRKESYLCFHFINKATMEYIQEMSRFNVGLRSAFLTSLAGGPAAAHAKIVFEGLTLARNGRHFYYIKKLFKNSYCPSPLALEVYRRNLPFLTHSSYLLITNTDQTTKLRENKWTVNYFHPPTGIRFKNSFVLSASFQVNNAFFPQPYLVTEEKTNKASLRWNTSSGSVFSF